MQPDQALMKQALQMVLSSTEGVDSLQDLIMGRYNGILNGDKPKIVKKPLTQEGLYKKLLEDVKYMINEDLDAITTKIGNNRGCHCNSKTKYKSCCMETDN